MRYKLNCEVKGKAKIIIRDAKTMKIKDIIELSNIMTNGALNVFSEAMVGGLRVWLTGNVVVRRVWYLVLGTGTGTPSHTDTALFQPIEASVKSGSLGYSGSTITYYVRYMPEDANGYEYTEAGIYDNIGYHPTDGGHAPNPYYTGVLMNHLMLSPTIVKDSSKLVDFYVMFTFTHV